MSKRMISISFIGLLLIFGWFWTEGYGFVHTDMTGNSIEEALFHYSLNGPINFKYGEILEIIETDNKYIVFYENFQTRAVNVAFIKKKWNGKRKVSTVSGSVQIDSFPGQAMPYSWKWLNEKDLTVYWGVVHDPHINNIKIDDEEAIIITVKNITIWYYKSHETFSTKEISAYDKNGHLIEWNNEY
ncbi:hypothetical protein [Caldalkalibacillus salinus]|uniref:hypothetical protein n=1 Tax=Caldalkalibacillus salinus TaxID=2803787 RepID=UPI0019243D25|nr:hypothetical protein [Caldalkalibacillus salinus]